MAVRHIRDLLVETYLLLDDGDHRILARFGLNPTQYAVLELLDQTRGRRPSELTAPLLLEKSSISRLLDRLVEQGLVSRVSDPTDRRSQRLVLTREGLALREQARIAYDRSLDQRLGDLDREEHDQLIAVLEKLRARLLTTLASEAS